MTRVCVFPLLHSRAIATNQPPIVGKFVGMF